jgi:hypothetical protein
VRVQRVHAHKSILMRDKPDHIDPDKWRPLIMSFQRFYGLGEELHESVLSSIPEKMYRSPDVDRARSSQRLMEVARGKAARWPGQLDDFASAMWKCESGQ